MARGKAEARVEFADGSDAVFESLGSATDRMNYENKYGYYNHIEHFVYEVEMKVKVKKLM